MQASVLKIVKVYTRQLYNETDYLGLQKLRKIGHIWAKLESLY